MAGKIIADQIEHSTAGTVDTQYVVNGSAKAWVNFTGITTTASRDSFNVSSLTDDTTGSTSITFSNNMSNANFTGSWFTNASTGSGSGNFGNDYGGGFAARTTSSYKVVAYSSDVIDSFYNDSIIFGDLA
jgi:hypothetical protein